MGDNRQNTSRLPSAKPLDEAAIQAFSSRLRGQLIRPEDDGYNEARTVFYGGFDRRPELIVRVKDAIDISRVIALAHESGLELAI
jgi:hypothetical protein